MAKNSNLVDKIGNEVYNWFNAITKEIEKNILVLHGVMKKMTNMAKLGLFIPDKIHYY